MLLLVQVDERHQYMRDKLRDDDLGDERLASFCFSSLKGLFNCNHSLDTSAIHVLHHQVYHAIIVKYAMVLHLPDKVRICEIELRRGCKLTN